MYKFLQGTKVIIEVLFPGEFRIGWEYEGVKYIPGSGSYYDLDTALDQAWQAFCSEFPHLTKREPDEATGCAHRAVRPAGSDSVICDDCGKTLRR